MVKPKVLKLANKIASGITGGLMKITPKDPEYKVIETVVTDEMAEVALCLEVRKPKSVREVANLCGKPIEEVEQILFQLAVDGVVKLEPENGVDKYFLELFVPGVMEYMVVNKGNVAKHPVIAECFEEYARKVGGMLAGNVPPGLGVMRVIPIQSSIEGDTRKASYEEIADLLNKHDTFSATDCACRIVRRTMGEGCGHTVEEMCIQLGPAADFYIRTGRGRRITREEAFNIIKQAEKEGLVHQIPNANGPGKTLAICNCCGCSCLALRNANLFRNPDFVRSNYVAQVERDKCVACGECVENCQVNALTLGENLCSNKKGGTLEERETPYDTEWGPDKWNFDYRHRQVVAESGTSPCKSECPAHIAVQGYIKMASQGGYTPGERYTFTINTKAHSNKGKNLKTTRSFHFNIEANDKNNSDNTNSSSDEWATIMQGESYPGTIIDPTTKKQVKVTWVRTTSINTEFIDADNINDCRISKVTLEGTTASGTKIKATIGIIPKILGITVDTNSNLIYSPKQQTVVINIDRNSGNGIIELKELSSHLKAVILGADSVTKEMKCVNVLSWSQLNINPTNINSYSAKVTIEHYNNNNPINVIINMQ